MESEGFNIELALDPTTGFIVGGNYRNQLTWMDKLGSSTKAGNKGFPATSRDGAPIELTALLKHDLDFVINCGQYKYDGVKLKNG
jgi:glycogen debranching enzyme